MKRPIGYKTMQRINTFQGNFAQLTKIISGKNTIVDKSEMLREIQKLVGEKVSVHYNVQKGPQPKLARVSKKKDKFSRAAGSPLINFILSPILSKIGGKKNKNGEEDYSWIYDCNGAVFDGGSNELISVGPPILIPLYGLPKIDLARTSKVYSLADGSVVTLYYHRGEWKFSTTNSADISNEKWFGKKTFKEAFQSAVEGTNFDYINLSTLWCYTVGFSYKEFHWCSTENTAWFIRAVKLRGLVKNSDLDIGLPSQKIGSKTEVEKFIIGEDVRSLGYIFRREEEKLPDIVIYSEQFAVIQNCVYSASRCEGVHSENRKAFVLLSNFIEDRGGKLVSVLPELAADIDRAEKFYDQLVDRVSVQLGALSPTESARQRGLFPDAASIADDIRSHFGVNPLAENGIGIISDLVRSAAYAPIAAEAFSAELQ